MEEENRTTVLRVAGYLDSIGIKPYDLHLAIGLDERVPDDIKRNRLDKLKESGMTKRIGFVSNALEDLAKMEFDNKERVIRLLQGVLELESGETKREGRLNKVITALRKSLDERRIVLASKQ